VAIMVSFTWDRLDLPVGDLACHFCTLPRLGLPKWQDYFSRCQTRIVVGATQSIWLSNLVATVF